MKVAIKGGYVPENSLKSYFLEELEKQRKIDIEKACEWLSNHSMVDTDLFKKAMEE